MHRAETEFHHTDTPIPGADLNLAKMPGHWLLARMGKRVLRPGGMELTRAMLRGLDIQSSDAVVELAPGLGVTMQLALERQPASYTCVERDEGAANIVRRKLRAHGAQCQVGHAEDTGLPAGSATVVYAEAMLTMQTQTSKERIVREVHRLLQPGGRYGIHELSLTPDHLNEDEANAICRDLSESIHVGARPLTAGEWRALLEREGFEVTGESDAPMKLLDPSRVIADEGIVRSVRIAANILRNPTARSRVRSMRRVFNHYRGNLGAIALVAVKREAGGG